MTIEQEFKTGFSMSLSISMQQKLVEYAYKLRTSKSEAARRILEYFIAHNNIKDIAE